MKLISSLVVLSVLSTGLLAGMAASETLTDNAARTYYGYRKSQAGGSCGTGSSQVCASGLVCETHICKLKPGKRCSGLSSLCASGAQCVGSGRRKRCAVPRGVGEACATTPFRVCASGLVCRKLTCARPEIPVGGRCARPGSVCVSGAVCTRTGVAGRRCVSVGGRGDSCRPIFQLCRAGLQCVRGKCASGRRGLAQPCGAKARCRRRLSCQVFASIDSAVCVKIAGTGESCGGVVVCQSGVKCVKGKCYRPYYYRH